MDVKKSKENLMLQKRQIAWNDMLVATNPLAKDLPHEETFTKKIANSSIPGTLVIVKRTTKLRTLMRISMLRKKNALVMCKSELGQHYENRGRKIKELVVSIRGSLHILSLINSKAIIGLQLGAILEIYLV